MRHARESLITLSFARDSERFVVLRIANILSLNFNVWLVTGNFAARVRG